MESREDLIALEADRIFSEELVSEIAGADPGGLAPSKAGFDLSASGRPNVVFSVVDGRLAIEGITDLLFRRGQKAAGGGGGVAAGKAGAAGQDHPVSGAGRLFRHPTAGTDGGA